MFCFASFYLKASFVSECGLDLLLPNITDILNISCTVSDSCLKLDCCVFVYEIQTTFKVSLDINPCELVTVMDFERLKTVIPWAEMEIGEFCSFENHTF